MIKRLLLCCSMAAVCLAGVAAENENKVYFNNSLGEVYGVSDNGKYVAVSDVESNMAYLWDSENPEVFTDISFDPDLTANLPSAQRVTGTLAYDVSDDGMVVGALIYADGHSVPAYLKDGEWTALTVLDTTLNTNQAIAVTPDGKTICGYNYVRSNRDDVPGGYIPLTWQLQEDDYYELTEIIDQYKILKYEHQGFYPMSMSANGELVCGELFAGSSIVVPAYIKGGELKIFAKITQKDEPWNSNGKWYCGVDEDGKQIWTDDPDDPRIVLFTEWYIDGYKDTAASDINGMFSDCHDNRYLYGARTLVSDVDEEGFGTLTNVACVYDLVEDKWYESDKYMAYATGIGTDLLFATGGVVVVDGRSYPIEEYYEIDSPSPIAGINRLSADGKVLGGCRSELNEATGEYQYFPFVYTIGTDAGVSDIHGGAEKVSFILSKGSAKVLNADKMTVYGLDGRAVADGAEIKLAPGVYVAKAGATTAKIQIR